MKNGLKPVENLFTSIDHTIVRAAIKKLPSLLSTVVEMRFWNNMAIYDIAEEIGVSVKTVEHSLTRAARMLREECLRNPAFSRSEFQALESMRANEVA